jgi:hypothetical protein
VSKAKVPNPIKFKSWDDSAVLDEAAVYGVRLPLYIFISLIF